MARAGNAVIGALKVSLSADTAQFEAGLKSAQSSLNKFGASLKGPLLAVAAGVATAFAGVAAGIKSALTVADDLGKAAQKFGVPVEQLSALAYAAKLSDVSLETLGQGLKKFSVNIAKAGGDVGTVNERLLAIADRFAAMPDGVNKTALAVKEFGKSGVELIPLLNQGAAGIKAMTDEARELGLVIDQETATAAERFNDNLTRLGSVVTGIFTQLAAGVAGPLANFTDGLVKIAKEGNITQVVIDGMNAVFNALGPTIVIVSAEFQRLATILSFLGGIIADLGTNNMEGFFARTAAAATKFNEDMKQIAVDVGRSLEAFKGAGAGRGGDPRTFMTGAKEQAQDTGKALDELVTKTKVAKDTIGDFPELIPAGYADLKIAGDRYQDQLKETQEFWSDIGRTIQNEVVNVMQDLVDGTFKWKDALSSALRMLAGILGGIGNQSITNAGGWGSIMGFAGGGQFRVGGSGGIDSQLVAFRATPGETVSVSNDNGPMGGFTFAPSTVIDARGSSMSQQEMKAILDARDRAWSQALPGQFKAARIRGKV